jgi:hypothetical protein
LTESENSKRVSLQATYTPIKSTEEKSGKPALALKRPFDKWNLIMSVKPTHGEVAYVRNTNKNTNEKDKDFIKAIKTIESVIPELDNPNVLHNVARFSEISADALLNVVDDIIKLRKKEGDSAIKTLNSIFDAYKQDKLAKSLGITKVHEVCPVSQVRIIPFWIFSLFSILLIMQFRSSGNSF